MHFISVLQNIYSISANGEPQNPIQWTFNSSGDILDIS